jgi:hypothetical protein
LLGGVVEQAHDFRFVAHVGLDGYGGTAFLLDGLDCGFGGLVLAEIVYADMESAGGGLVGGGGSYASAGAGDY